MRTRLIPRALLALAVATAGLQAAEIFSDVPRGHWAFDAIQRAVEAGILEGVDGRFHGDKLITRHQMAIVVAKLLDRIQQGGPRIASKLQPRDIANLEALTIEFADELALMNVKLSTLEDAFVELRNTVEALKAGQHIEHGPAPYTPQFAGLLSFGLVSTEDQVGGTPSLSRYAGTPDRFFFTVPQASLSMDMDLGQGVGSHIQFDYSPDGPSVLGGGGGVQLNEAYITWDNGPGHIGAKMGLMALPMQSWEYNGPMRTLNDSITPSGLNWLWERHRIVGAEASRALHVSDHSIQWRAGVFTGNDNAGAIGTGPTTGRVYGNILASNSDAPVPGTGSANLEDTPGFYLDVESPSHRSWGWRLSFFDVGGDNSPGATQTASNDWGGFQAGGWLRGDSWKLQGQALFGTEDYGAGAANSDDMMSAYLSFRYNLDPSSTLFLRGETWELDNGASTSLATGDREGTAFTFAYNRQVTDTSMFQFEYLANSEDTPAGVNDTNDNLLQARYKVWW